MLNKQEIQNWILENCTDKYGNIVLSDLDFEDRSIYLDGIKAYKINNSQQKAEIGIINNKQKSFRIENMEQESNIIYNIRQRGEEKIYNFDQKAKKVYT